jgi:UDP-N-acetylmuramoylalanine--D-glutamate ligase
MRFDDIATLSVAILGLGREGQAVWRKIRSRYPDKTIHLFAESTAADGFIETLDPELDHCHFGSFDVERLRMFDLLVRSAGISPYRAELQKLRSLGVRFTTANSLWFAENPDAKTICISGTKGKSTTAALITHLLNCAGVKACLSGNIGRPMLDCDIRGVDWWVIELSSYQLSDLEAEPDMALLLNLSDEHIDWHGDAHRYRADKLKLAEMAGHGSLVANFSDPVLLESLTGRNDVVWFNRAGRWQAGESGVISGDGVRAVSAPVSLPGEHNMQNLAAALTVFDELGLEIPDIDQALASFTGLPHRLQMIGHKNGIRYVDDSISTTPVSVLAALNTIGFENTVLLLGGLDRGLEWDEFAEALSGQEPAAIITMPDNGPKVLASLKKFAVEPLGGLHTVENLLQAVALAQTLVPDKGSILLSPGAPSFPHFRDFEERGDQFAKHAGIEK